MKPSFSACSSPDQLQHGGRSNLQSTPRIVLVLTSTLVLLAIVPLYMYPLMVACFSSAPARQEQDQAAGSSSSRHASSSTSTTANAELLRSAARMARCDIFRGEWVPNPRAPYYTNETCWAIHNHQNCMKYGRPDADFLKWRWKPNDCELPVFNPGQFLELVRGKTLAFLGDSVARNQMQSLICLLSRVTYAVDASVTDDEKFRRYHFPTHNFTVASFWSPYLVRTEEVDSRGSGLFNLHLDEPDANWTAHIEDFDYVILSAGHWFFRPTMFYQDGGRLVGCHYCLLPNVTDLTMYHSYRMAFRTTFRAFNGFGRFRGMLFLRTFAPSHFENGEWNKGGDCVRTRPLRSNETRMEGINLEMYMIQLEEYRAAMKAAAAAASGGGGRVRFRLLDTTDATLLRPDGHPSKYGHPAKANVTMYNDCVHWCLPGPIDSWNDFLLHMLKMEGGRSPLRRAVGLRMF